MTAKDDSAPFRELRDQPSDQCLPCLSDSGVLFCSVCKECRRVYGRYTTLYLLLFVAALVQYFATAGASPGAWTCSYCSLEQPPRSKHCNECDKWYICTETALCLWAGIVYMGSRTWWKDVIIILLLCGLLIILVFLLLLLFFHSYLVLTNQTTYEIVRRRHISYLRGSLRGCTLFSKGIRQNLYRFCCARGTHNGTLKN